MVGHYNSQNGPDEEEMTPGLKWYYISLDEQELTAQRRRGKAAPMDWGEKIKKDGVEGYFCHSCWFRGLDDGFHPYSDPPCDPLPPRGVEA